MSLLLGGVLAVFCLVLAVLNHLTDRDAARRRNGS